MVEIIIIWPLLCLLLGFVWPWLWIFPGALATFLVYMGWSDYKSKLEREEYMKNYKPIILPEPKIGMTEDEVKSKSIWGWPSSINETVTPEGVERDRYYDYKGRLIFKNNILVKIVKFDTKS